ncbi:MAG: DUF3575 domain-containing protein [Bacteroidia bacterium]
MKAVVCFLTLLTGLAGTAIAQSDEAAGRESLTHAISVDLINYVSLQYEQSFYEKQSWTLTMRVKGLTDYPLILKSDLGYRYYFADHKQPLGGTFIGAMARSRYYHYEAIASSNFTNNAFGIGLKMGYQLVTRSGFLAEFSYGYVHYLLIRETGALPSSVGKTTLFPDGDRLLKYDILLNIRIGYAF